MKTTRRLRMVWISGVLLGGLQMGLMAHADYLDSIGVTLLRSVTTNVDGQGIRVAQAEAGAPYFEVNPASTLVQQPVSLFTYITSSGATNYFPNSLGLESVHADTVASNFYGLPAGIATNVAHVDNYDADYLYNDIIASASPPDINDPLVNQSFLFGYVTNSSSPPQNFISVSEQQMLDAEYDNYAAEYGTLFVSAVGNAYSSSPPGTCYNGIGVGDYGGGSSVGPTLDNGRAKPDITAPEIYSSSSTPEVTGAAALLMQAGLRGDGGSDTNGAADMRTVKALLLNGAVKPANWTNDPPSPLDPRYGAGILNVFNSYEQLAGGRHSYISSTSVSVGGSHPPDGATGTVNALSGWDFNTISSSVTSDRVYHYYFDVTNNVSGANFTTASTLVWNRQRNKSAINNLDLFLYNAASNNLVAASTSVVDNVEHLWLPQLPQGRYDLQVLKHGGVGAVSSSETYALAWEFFYTTLNATQSDTNVVLTWPIYPDGFVVEAATSLKPPISWTAVTTTPIVTNGQNEVTLNAAGATRFFRLRRP